MYEDRWVEKHNKEIASFNGSTFILDGREYFPYSEPSSKHKVHAFYDEWKLTTFFRYRPLIFFSIFNTRYLPMLALSLTSLSQLGNYDGELLIVSDLGRDVIEEVIPSRFEKKWHLWTISVANVLEIFLVKYRIHEWVKSEAFQPLFYSDADVIFDAPVEFMLREMACCSRIMGQGEPCNSMTAVVGFGSTLFLESKVDVGTSTGFCAGTMAFPNTASFKDELCLLVEGARQCYRSKGPLPWEDQPYANYAAFRLGGFDTDILYRYVRWGGREALHGGLNPRGLVHLWGATDKIGEMEDFYKMLLGKQREADDLPWNIYGHNGLHKIYQAEQLMLSRVNA